jgi:hypothetical protein
MIKNEASQFAETFEQMGCRVLDHCSSFPDAVLQWPLPLAEPCSLLSLAGQLADTIDYWILIQIGNINHPPRKSRSGPPHPLHTFAELNSCYRKWIKDVHATLDGLPDVFMDLFIGTRSSEEDHSKRHQQKDQILTTRQCLLQGLTQGAEYAGQILLIRKLFDDGNRLSAEVAKEEYVSH